MRSCLLLASLALTACSPKGSSRSIVRQLVSNTSVMIGGVIVGGMILSRAIVRDMVPAAEAASMLGYVTMGMAMVPMFSPMIGGAIDELLGWQAIFVVLVLAIGVSNWVHFARTVRGSTMVEKNKEYVQAARVIGRKRSTIMFRHVLPNVMGPVLVIATIGLAIAILTEATLSFLGVGAPPTKPSLGTLIRIGQDFLFAGEWWIVIFPGIALAILVLAVNLLGDWMRDALNPKLR